MRARRADEVVAELAAERDRCLQQQAGDRKSVLLHRVRVYTGHRRLGRERTPI